MTHDVNSNLETSLPLISVIIPYYNRPHLLKRAIRSVIEQSYSPIELIIVDDCSETRSARSIIDDYSEIEAIEKLSVFRHDSNRGASEARNTGIHHANGEYIAFLDDDDTWDETKIEKQVDSIVNTDVSLVYCGVRRVGPDENTRATYCPTTEGDVTEELLCGNITGTSSTILISTQLAQNINGFDSQFLRWNDWDFVLRAAKQGSFGVISDLLVTQYNSTKSQLSGDHEKLEISAERFREKHCNFAKSKSKKKLFYGWTEWGLGQSAMSNGHYHQARRYFLNSIRYHPWNKDAYVYLLAVSGGHITYELSKRLRRSSFSQLKKIKSVLS